MRLLMKRSRLYLASEVTVETVGLILMITFHERLIVFAHEEKSGSSIQ